MKEKRLTTLTVFLALMVGFSHCAHQQTDSENVTSQEDEDDFAQEKVELTDVLTQLEEEEESQVEPDPAPVPDDDESKIIMSEDESRTEFPLVMNHPVRVWMNYYQTRGRNHFQRYLERSTKYLPIIQKVFQEEGLPQDLAYKSLVESGFSVRAYSRAHAVGLWQFIAPTARRYGLTVNWWLDERRDPEKAARAAAAYLKDLYGMFDSWYLAVAAYNVGENKIESAVRKYRTKNFWQLSKYRYLPRETKQHIPKIIAAIIMAKNPQKYGFTDLDMEKPLEFETIEVNQAIDLKQFSAKLGVDYETIQDLNPMFRRPVTPPDLAVDLNVPVGMTAAANLVVAELEDDENVQRYVASHKNYAQNYRAEADRPVISYRVRRGDTLNRIARKFRVSLNDIRKQNRMGRRGSRIHIGQILKVPHRGYVAEDMDNLDIPKSSSIQSEISAQIHTYTVKRGDTLTRIARRLQVEIRALMTANSLTHRSRIYVGQLLKVPGA